MLAAILSTPELQLGDDAGRQYAEAVVAYARHHDIAAQAKTVDLVNLLMVACGHYGMAFMAARLRHKADAAAAINGHDPAAPWNGAASVMQEGGNA